MDGCLTEVEYYYDATGFRACINLSGIQIYNASMAIGIMKFPNVFQQLQLQDMMVS